MTFNPAGRIQAFQVFGEFGGVNPSITDSSTYTFMNPETMKRLFSEEIEGCFLYSRHWSPITRVLSDALAAMEDTQSAQVTASGMAAIAAAILQLCGSGDEIVASRTIYGGTYALFKNFLPRFGITVQFVDYNDLDALRASLTSRTRVLYCESMSNPLLAVPDLPAVAEIARQAGATMMVDNTFTPMILSPARLGAHVVVHSLTKYINGNSDCMAGVVCASHEFVEGLTDVNSGACMLLGPALDSARAASIYKNLHDLHIRMQKHGENAAYIAGKLHDLGLNVNYPGLASHAQFDRLNEYMNPGFGYGGMLTLDAGSEANADRLLTRLQEAKVGLLAVSLGYFRTLFSPSGNSTSSEIPREEQDAMGLTTGLIRFSIGLDHDISETWDRMLACLEETGLA